MKSLFFLLVLSISSCETAPIQKESDISQVVKSEKIKQTETVNYSILEMVEKNSSSQNVHTTSEEISNQEEIQKKGKADFVSLFISGLGYVDFCETYNAIVIPMDKKSSWEVNIDAFKQKKLDKHDFKACYIRIYEALSSYWKYTDEHSRNPLVVDQILEKERNPATNQLKTTIPYPVELFGGKNSNSSYKLYTTKSTPSKAGELYDFYGKKH